MLEFELICHLQGAREMLVWNEAVNFLSAAIFAYSQACGGQLGVGILAVTFLVRATMFPLTLRLARASAAQRALMQKIKPELDQIRKRFSKQPERLTQETQRIYERENASPLPLKGCLGNLVQMPVLLALFTAVRRCVQGGGRFCWIGNIAKPDFLLATVVAAITCVTAALGTGTSDQNHAVMIAIPTVLTFVVLLRMAAGVGLYWGVSSLFSLLQSVILYRERVVVERAS